MPTPSLLMVFLPSGRRSCWHTEAARRAPGAPDRPEQVGVLHDGPATAGQGRPFVVAGPGMGSRVGARGSDASIRKPRRDEVEGDEPVAVLDRGHLAHHSLLSTIAQAGGSTRVTSPIPWTSSRTATPPRSTAPKRCLCWWSHRCSSRLRTITTATRCLPRLARVRGAVTASSVHCNPAATLGSERSLAGRSASQRCCRGAATPIPNPSKPVACALGPPEWRR